MTQRTDRATGPKTGTPWSTRVRVWRAGFGAQPAEFAVPPEPISIGSAAMGRQICEGHILLAGRRMPLEGDTLWSVPLGDPAAEAERQGFTWLDDLAAAGTREAMRIGRDWLVDWLHAYDAGQGPGWAPHVAARRLVRWTYHATDLLDGLDKAHATRFRKCLSRHVLYLAQNWRAAAPGLDTFEALTGFIQGGLALAGMEPKVRPAIKALERLCREEIDVNGGLPSRRPEELLDLFTMLVWSETAMTEVGLLAQTEHRAAIQRIAPTLRALRQADGALARFHGGGRGIEGRLDAALAAARVRGGPREGLAMGYARLARGRTTVILDGARPPSTLDTAHASTLAFEMTVGRRPILVNCGSGLAFGPDWHRAARATPAHSTLAPEGASSGRLKSARRGRRDRLILTQGPEEVRCDPAPERGPASLTAVHDGFLTTFGLLHIRRLDLGSEGLILSGEDVLTAPSEADRKQMHAYLRQKGQRSLGLTVRFHLHPDVNASLAEEGRAVQLMLKSGELWLFRHIGNARISLDPSVYLEKTRPQPVPTRQIVLETHAVDYTTTVRWSLSRAQSHQPRERDLYRDDMSIT